MIHRVRLALRETGSRKAVMPLLMASIPVSAVQPAAKVWSRRNDDKGTTCGAAAHDPGPSRSATTAPQASIPRKATRNK